MHFRDVDIQDLPFLGRPGCLGISEYRIFVCQNKNGPLIAELPPRQAVSPVSPSCSGSRSQLSLLNSGRLCHVTLLKPSVSQVGCTASALLSVSPSLPRPQLTLSVTGQYLPRHHLYARSSYLVGDLGCFLGLYHNSAVSVSSFSQPSSCVSSDPHPHAPSSSLFSFLISLVCG